VKGGWKGALPLRVAVFYRIGAHFKALVAKI
jgi:hypothetical protein